MISIFWSLLGSFLLLVMSAAFVPAQAEDELVHVRMETSMGNIYLALNKTKAPESVDNFLQYAKGGYYYRLIFHRVVRGYIVQGGGYNSALYERAKRDPIKSEADNGLKNLRGTIAMARNDDPHSAQSQFFFNVKDNPGLDHQGKDFHFDWGYAVFGEVVAGMDVVDGINTVPTEGRGDFAKDVPVENVFINMIRVIDEDEVPEQ